MRSPLVLVCVVALFLVASQVAPAPKVGVVDLNVVFEAHPRKPAMEASLGEIKAELDGKLETLEKRAQELETQLDVLEKGTSRYHELERDLYRVRQDAKYEKGRAAEEFTARMRELHGTLLKDIRRAIDDYAVKEGFSLVLRRELRLAEDRPTWDLVLFREPQVDITGEVVATLE